MLRHGAAAVAPLCAILRDPKTWEPEELPEAMFPIHLVYLLGCLGDPRATPTLIEAAQKYDLGDHLTEGLASVFGALGPGAVPSLLPVLLDHAAEPFVRNAAGRGLYLVGGWHPEARAEVVAALIRVVREADLEHDSDFATVQMLTDDAVRTGDPEALAAVREAFARGLADGAFTDASLLDRWSAKAAWQLRPYDARPITHFERGRRAPRGPSSTRARVAFGPVSTKVPARGAEGRPQ